jgi:D-sedoheptulose 7-phosphate isomerase
MVEKIRNCNIRVLALDIDGVLTDGTAVLNGHDTEEKRFNFHDLDAVTQARRSGMLVTFVSGEETPSVDCIAKRFGVQQVVKGAKDKAAALVALSNEMAIPLSAFCYIGDSDRDAPALTKVGLGLAPENATAAAKASAHRVMSRRGGQGVVAEAVALLDQIRVTSHQGPAFVEQIRHIVGDSLSAHERLLNESLPVLAEVAQVFLRALRSGNKILLFGNGGSAADAQHVAAELIGRFARESEPWPAIALTTDTSTLTCVANDWDYSQIFSRQVRALAKPGDVVAGISTSGRSPNVLRGLEAGRNRGAVTIGFTGANGGSMRELCDVLFCGPSQATPRIQELHILAWHAICELVETELMK